MKLPVEILDEIAAKIVKEGEPDDLPKFMLTGKECIAAVQRFFNSLEADKKKDLTLRDDEWFLGLDGFRNDYDNAHTGLSLFKLVAPFIIPYVEMMHIINARLRDYTFLKDIDGLFLLGIQLPNQDFLNLLSALSNFERVDCLSLNIKNLNLQLLGSLSFSFGVLTVFNFVFEVDPKCDKVFEAREVNLYGDEEAMNDFVFTRQNFENYVVFFPHAFEYSFEFYIKLADDVSSLLDLSHPNYSEEVEVLQLPIQIKYNLFDYSGHPTSKVLEMLRNDERWDTDGCPCLCYSLFRFNLEIRCWFPLAIESIADRLAEKPLHRIPQDANRNSEDFHRVTIQNPWEHKAEFEILKGLSKEEVLEAYGEITEINAQYLQCDTDFENLSNGDLIRILYVYR